MKTNAKSEKREAIIPLANRLLMTIEAERKLYPSLTLQDQVLEEGEK